MKIFLASFDDVYRGIFHGDGKETHRRVLLRTITHDSA